MLRPGPWGYSGPSWVLRPLMGTQAPHGVLNLGEFTTHIGKMKVYSLISLVEIRHRFLGFWLLEGLGMIL